VNSALVLTGKEEGVGSFVRRELAPGIRQKGQLAP